MQPAIGPCPICGQELRIKEYECTGCGVALRGQFAQCAMCSLPSELRHFVQIFLESEGNFREVQRRLGVSYPTVKSRLNSVIGALAATNETAAVKHRTRIQALTEFKDGKISFEDVIGQL